MLVILTGLRRQDAASLRWEQVDMKTKTLRIIDTKNNVPHTLPLSTYLRNLLQIRLATAKSDFVFPAPSATGHIMESKKQNEWETSNPRKKPKTAQHKKLLPSCILLIRIKYKLGII